MLLFFIAVKTVTHKVRPLMPRVSTTRFLDLTIWPLVRWQLLLRLLPTETVFLRWPGLAIHSKSVIYLQVPFVGMASPGLGPTGNLPRSLLFPLDGWHQMS